MNLINCLIKWTVPTVCPMSPCPLKTNNEKEGHHVNSLVGLLSFNIILAKVFLQKLQLGWIPIQILSMQKKKCFITESDSFNEHTIQQTSTIRFHARCVEPPYQKFRWVGKESHFNLRAVELTKDTI